MSFNEITLEELKTALREGARCILQLRHAERPKMDPNDPTFGDGLALTPEGCRTARLLGESLAEFRDDVSFWSSPLRRTCMTAELIAEGMGLKNIEIPTEGRLGNDSFYYANPMEVLDVFRPPENFFPACFHYFATGEQRGFRNLYAATADLENWLWEHFHTRLFIVATHDCYIAAYLAAQHACEGFSRDNWPRFLDGAALIVRPDGSREYALVRTGFSSGICGVVI